MTPQRKGRIKKLFKTYVENLQNKLDAVPQKEKIRIISMHVKLGNYECIIYYNFKTEKFTRIQVIEETIEL